ncbi:MAG: 2-C-methyl-D-erythritol 4-phosphate cytidylyltransferase [Prevotella sp.]|nr:2-C-methyl-D-erythritol 4-phosphate cytidylyltransferase [Prevotella sp.]
MKEHNTDYVIIVAGGRGLRMGSDVPKQFLPVCGRPVLMRTIERFREYSPELRIILVLPRDQQDYWRELCGRYGFSVDYQMADGGETRFHSVSNGLELIPADADGVVGVHDGVRPFPSVDVVGRCYEEARRMGAVIPVVPVVETLRHVTDGTVPRGDYRLVQTPQTFDIRLLRRAYGQDYSDAFTDDASVVEAMGHEITIVEGNRENIKITTPWDLRVAEVVINQTKTHPSPPEGRELG